MEEYLQALDGHKQPNSPSTYFIFWEICYGAYLTRWSVDLTNLYMVTKRNICDLQGTEPLFVQKE
jgi:hypothetical protein